VHLGCKACDHCVGWPVMTAVTPLKGCDLLAWCMTAEGQELMPAVRGITGEILKWIGVFSWLTTARDNYCRCRFREAVVQWPPKRLEAASAHE
jgi:hypothetical protein